MTNRLLPLLLTGWLVLPTTAQAASYPEIRIETTAGSFTVRLDDERAPLTVANFLQYVRDGFYNGLVFHRVVDGFVIQGGGYDPELNPKQTRESIPNEAGNGLSNRRGTIAMARTSDPHSADSQFYINLADNVALDPKSTRWGYAVFGEVTAGMEVVDDIGHRATGPQKGMTDVPAAPVIIERMVIVE